MLLQGDCLDRLKDLEDNSIDSIVTDPPYGLSFMGKKWDYDVPSTEIWRECFRVLKPGAHLLSFSSARTYHRMVVNVEDAGFEIRDQLMWVYGSGFPKNHNIGNGWGTALKPAHEPIVMARKPLSEKTIKENVAKWGVGGINIDDSRVPYEDNPDPAYNPLYRYHNRDRYKQVTDGGQKPGVNSPFTNSMNPPHEGGRHPANLIHNGDQTVLDLFPDIGGSAARFFYCAKASKRERNGNNHPTVKPQELMSYLVKLVTPLQGIVLDPFMGSGTTCVAAKNFNIQFIGIEKDPDYFQLAQTRINSHSH